MSYTQKMDGVDLAHAEDVRVQVDSTLTEFKISTEMIQDGDLVFERSLIAVNSDGSYIAVPLVDLVKYIMSEEPEIIERARAALLG